jgi:hypothetical protein
MKRRHIPHFRFMTKTAFTKMGNLGLSLQRVARHTNAGVGHLIFMKAKRPLPNLTLRKSWKRPTTKPGGESLFLYLPAVSNLAGNPSFLLRHVNWKIDWPFSALNLVGSL